MKAEEGRNAERKNPMSLLANKPIWVFWIVFVLLSGILFGIFYTAIYFMVQRWWIPVVVIIAIGIIWGSLAYTGSKIQITKNKAKEEKISKKG